MEQTVREIAGNNSGLLAQLDPRGQPATELDLVSKPFHNPITTYEEKVVINQRGTGGNVLAKQALSAYLGSPLPRERVHVEVQLRKAWGALSPEKFTATLHDDSGNGLLILEHCTPHLVLRHDLWSGIRYPLLAQDASSCLARTVHGTSVWTKHPPAAVKEAIAEIDGPLGNNKDMVSLSSELMFDAPWTSGGSGRFPVPQATSPVVAAWASALRGDKDIVAAVTALKERYLTAKECLCHGDFSTGSLMTAVIRSGPAALNLETMRPDEYQGKNGQDAANNNTAVGDMKVLGGERANMGPAGFDLGVLMGNLVLAFASARARVRKEEVTMSRGGYAKFSAQKARDRWAEHAGGVADWIASTWAEFAARFVAAWDSDASGGQAASHAHDDHGHGCCDDGHDHPAVPAAVWKEQITVLSGILADALGYCGCEIARRVLGPERVLDMEQLDPTARPGTEARLLAMTRYTIGQAKAIATAVMGHALSAASRDDALSRLACGFDPLVAAVAAIDGEPGWTAVDKAGAAVIPASGLPGRPYSATLVLVAKSPVHPGPVRSSLAASLPTTLDTGAGPYPTREAAARALHAASVADIAARMSVDLDSNSNVRRVLLYVPGDASTETALSSWLASEQATPFQGGQLPPGTGPEAAKAWASMPGAGSGAISDRKDLTSLLHEAFSSCLRTIWGPVVLLSSDCPAVPWEHVQKALQAAQAGQAYVLPAHDGGLCVVGLPPQVVVPLEAVDEGVAPSSCGPFAGVAWASETTALTQEGVLQDRFGLKVHKPAVDPTLVNVMTSEDVLRAVSSMGGAGSACPRLTSTLEALKLV